MKLVEIIEVKKSKELYDLCHNCKNLYNLALYYCNMNYEIMDENLNYYDLNFMLRWKEQYRILPCNTSAMVLRTLDKNWKSYFRALKDYKKNWKKYKKKPRPPRKKPEDGEILARFTYAQIQIKNGILKFPKKANLPPIYPKIAKKLKEVRIIPLGIKYKIEIVYEKKEQDLKLNKKNIFSIDLGLNNIIAGVNNNGFKPFIIKGGIAKSNNHYYNKKFAYYRSIENKKGNFRDTKRIKRLHLKHNNKINLFFHRVSKQIIEYCKENDIGTVIIGYNKDWKQNINLGKKTNQNFVQLPFLKLVNQLKYKGELIGIDVQTISEEYTSQKCCRCGIIDKKNRIKRGLYICKKCGLKINADINASYNIMKKAFPNSISVEGIQVFQLTPQIFTKNIYDLGINLKSTNG